MVAEVKALAFSRTGPLRVDEPPAGSVE